MVVFLYKELITYFTEESKEKGIVRYRLNNNIPTECCAKDCPYVMPNPVMKHLSGEEAIYQNISAVTICGEDQGGFSAKSDILTGKYNEATNDENVYENTAYLKNKAIYPISTLLFKNKGEIILIIFNGVSIC